MYAVQSSVAFETRARFARVAHVERDDAEMVRQRRDRIEPVLRHAGPGGIGAPALDARAQETRREQQHRIAVAVHFVADLPVGDLQEWHAQRLLEVAVPQIEERVQLSSAATGS